MNEIDDSLLHAWLDGELPAAERDRVAAWLEAHPEAAQQVRGWAADRDALHARPQPLPPESAQRSISRHGRGSRQRWLLAAAMAALFVLGAAFGSALTWHVQREPAGSRWTQRAVLAHSVYAPELRHPVEVQVASAAGGELAVKRDQLAAWLSGRVGVPVTLFDLNALGFELVGGRLLPDVDGAGQAAPGAQLMYQEVGGALRITVYLHKPETEMPAAFRYERQGELGLFSWRQGPPGKETGYALVGALPKDRLLELVTAIYRQGGATK